MTFLMNLVHYLQQQKEGLKNVKNKKKLFIQIQSGFSPRSLKGERDINMIATENNIQPNLLRNWKKEFLEKADVVFDDTREENLKAKLSG